MEFSRREFLGAVSVASLSGASRLQAQGGTADLVLFNGKVVTVDDAFSIRQAIVIKDGRILEVGGNELRNRYSAASTTDLRGPAAGVSVSLNTICSVIMVLGSLAQNQPCRPASRESTIAFLDVTRFELDAVPVFLNATSLDPNFA